MPATPARAPVRLTERLLATAFTIKTDLEKAVANWETNFRDPVKEAMLAQPQVAQPGVTEMVLGGVRVFLAKTFPKDAFDILGIASQLRAAVNCHTVGLSDLEVLISTGAITVAKPADVLAVLVTRGQVASAAAFVIQPEHPDVPSRVDLKWQAVPGRAALVGPLVGLPDQVAVAAAAANTGRQVVAPAGTSPAMAAAMAIDAQNAGRIQPAGVAVRRDPPAAALPAIEDIEVAGAEAANPRVVSARRGRSRARRTT
jgi:hypothetical protein